jgi:hypothetical protein
MTRREIHERITEMCRAATAAGDLTHAETCIRALAGDAQSWAECVGIIDDAQRQLRRAVELTLDSDDDTTLAEVLRRRDRVGN